MGPECVPTQTHGYQLGGRQGTQRVRGLLLRRRWLTNAGRDRMPITAPGSAEERQATRLDKELLGSTWDGPIKKGSFAYRCLATLYIVLLRDHPLHHALAILPRAVRAALAAKGQPKPQAREVTTRQCTKHKSMSSAHPTMSLI